ncbi:MAG: TIR domain-containing protein [Actinomycetota bacterium]
MAGNIFINYRRDDDAGFTQALYSRLEQAFSPERLFMDIDNIAPGLDFVQVLNDEVARCDVVIAVVGKNWLSVTDETGARRLDNPEDFVRIELESALAHKKRVIPVLVNDARMPRSTELPEAMRAFARCNAVRLTHERFRADVVGLIKSLEQVLSEAEAARQAGEEEALREAKAKESEGAERLKQSRKARAAKLEARLFEAGSQAPSTGIASWIVGLPSEVSRDIPLALIGVVLLGSILPAFVFAPGALGGLNSSLAALIYGVAGLIAIGVLFRMRRDVMGGAELALYWLATIFFLGRAATALASMALGQPPSFLPIAVVALAAAAALIVLRRNEMGGLEFAVYWFGLTLFIYAAGISVVVSATPAAELRTSVYDAAVLLLSAAIVSGAAILAWRNRRLSKPELAVYVMGLAYWAYAGLRLTQS